MDEQILSQENLILSEKVVKRTKYFIIILENRNLYIWDKFSENLYIWNKLSYFLVYKFNTIAS